MKPFFLYVHKQNGTTIGVLTQLLGSWHCLVVYLSKQLDALSQGWLPWLCALEALVKEADKLTLGQELTARVPHSVLTFMGYYWLTNSWMVKYQSMLCENLCVQLEVIKTLNLATLLPTDLGSPKHDCLEVMDEVFSSQPAYRQFGHWIFHRWQQLCLGWHTLCQVCGGDFRLSQWSLPAAGRDFCAQGWTCHPHVGTPGVHTLQEYE
jgi:hypothetical protein